MSFVKTSFYSAISTSISLITKLISNKIVAVYLGTHGMFLLGQLKDLIKISSIASDLGTSNGIIKYVAEYEQIPKKLNAFLGSGFKLHLLSSVIVCILIFAFRYQISTYLFDDLKFSNALALLSISFVTLSLNTFFISVLNGLRNIKFYVVINIISTIISATITILMVINHKIIGAFYAIAINQILIFFISLLFIVSYKLVDLKGLKKPLTKFHFKNLTKFSLMALTGPLSLVVTTLYVRSFLLEELGNDYAGSWEGMWRISAMYLLFLTTTFRFYIVPTFSSLSGNDLKKEIIKIWSIVTPIIIVITLSVYVLKDTIISLLFSKEFILINTIILFHLLGDAFKMNSWVLGNILISKARTKAFVLFQIFWGVIFCLLTVILVNGYGFIGVSIAYFISYIIHFIGMNIYFRKLLWVKQKH